MSDDGFFTACPTCAADLKVRERSAIGQIFACPMCGSMVLVESPDASDPLPESAAAVMPEESQAEPQPIAELENSARSLPFAAGFVSLLAVAVVAGIATHALRQDAPLNQDDVNKVTVVDAANVVDAVDHLPLFSPEEEKPADAIVDNVHVDRVFDAAIVEDPAPEPVANVPDRESPIVEVTAESVAALSNMATLLGGVDSNDSNTSNVQVEGSTLATKANPIGSSARFLKDATSNLDRTLPLVQFHEISLLEFVRTLTQLSGVPISIDPLALEYTAVSTRDRITVSGVNLSIRETLERGVRQRKLSVDFEGQVVLITNTGLKDGSHRPISFFVGDLLHARGQHFDLPTLVMTLVEPRSWQGRGGSGTIKLKGDTLRMSTSRRIAVQTLALLEKVRVSRGLKPRSKMPARWTNTTPRWEQVERYMQHPISLSVWHDQPWPEVVSKLERVSGFHFLFDWQALISEGITPNSMTHLHFREMLTEDVLDRLLASTDLALRVIDAKTIQITTEAGAKRHPYVEVYRVDRVSARGMSVIESLMLDGAAALDPTSEVAVIVADSVTHREILRD